MLKNKAAIVVANFYPDIAAGLANSARQAFVAAGFEVVERATPGVLELPRALQIVIEQESPVCIAALGCVVRGETYHFEMVANTAAAGMMQVQLQTEVGIGNGVLAVNNMEQARARLRKGAEAANAAMALARLARPPNGDG